MLFFANLGSSFINLTTVSAVVENHRYGAVASYTEDSDLIDDFYQVYEMYCYKNNIKSTIFTAQEFINQSVSLDIESAGRLRHELYHRADLNPTAAGLNSEKIWFNNVFSRKPSVLSYRNGVHNHSDLLKDLVIAGRNSDAKLDRLSDGDSYFGIGLGLPNNVPVSSNWIDRANTTRIWETSGNDATSLAYCMSQLSKTINNNGWHNNFMHARDPHTAGKLDYTDWWLNAVNSQIGSNFVWRTSYGEAVEYAYFRSLITNVTAALSGNSISIVVKKSSYVNHDLISVPISVKIDTTGTTLEGKDFITNSVGIRKVSANIFVVDIAKGVNGGDITATLTETTTPSYYNFNLPAIVTATVNGDVLTVVTDIPTKVSTWIADRGALQKTALLNKRSNTLQTTHVITLNAGDTAKDIYISLLSKEEQSILSNAYQFI